MQVLADQLKLSRFAISRALSGGPGVSEETRRRVIEAAERLGYTPPSARRGMDRFHTRNILFMIGAFRFEDQSFWPRVIAGAEAATRQRRLNLMITVISPEEEAQGAMPVSLLQRNVDGVLAVGEFQPAFLTALRAQEQPTVLVDVDGAEYMLDAVITSDYEGGALGVRHLQELGHRRIGFVGDLSFASSFSRRYIGFLQAKQRLGLLGENAVALVNHAESHYWDLGEVTARLANGKNLPTAFVCANDRSALILIQALQDKGLRVPDDVSVVGFDDIAQAGANQPPLTTIQVCKERLGERAVELLEWRLGNPRHPRETAMIGTKLVVRESTAPPKE